MLLDYSTIILDLSVRQLVNNRFTKFKVVSKDFHKSLHPYHRGGPYTAHTIY